jgi:hypothetical protein
VRRWRAAAPFFAVGVVGPLVMFALDRDPPYDIENIEAVPAIIMQPAATITLRLTIKRNRPGTCGRPLVKREFKDPHSGRLYLVDPLKVSAVDEGRARVTVPLPADIPSIPMQYRHTVCYDCNPMQNWLHWPVCVTTPYANFEIKDGP